MFLTYLGDLEAGNPRRTVYGGSVFSRRFLRMSRVFRGCEPWGGRLAGLADWRKVASSRGTALCGGVLLGGIFADKFVFLVPSASCDKTARNSVLKD